MVPTCKHHLHHYRLRYRTSGNFTENVRLRWCFLPYLRCAPNHHRLLDSHRSHIVGGLQKIWLDHWTFNGYNHRLTRWILGLSSRVVDMDSQLDSCNIFQCSCSEFFSVSECEFWEYPNLQVHNETKNVTKKELKTWLKRHQAASSVWASNPARKCKCYCHDIIDAISCVLVKRISIIDLCALYRQIRISTPRYRLPKKSRLCFQPKSLKFC